jgi:hypothetical protein
VITYFFGFLKEVDGKMNLSGLLLGLKHLPPLNQFLAYSPIRELVKKLKE